ncbi:MAG TPA: hypothetical protein VFB41_02100 [Solirubrobacteraceae bacterium]|nr:hypothetical protein [Solirubrobacteraceae bacterium]
MKLLFAGVAALLAAGAIAGCGTESHDLFIVERAGSIPGAKLRLHVSDSGTVECNGTSKEMPSKMLILTRVLARDLAKPAIDHVSLPARKGSTLRYSFRVEDGVTRFADNSLHQPPVFYRAALLVRQIAQGPCGLAR